MNSRKNLAAGFVIALGVMLVAPSAGAGGRLLWDSAGGTVSWHRACAFAHPTPDPGPSAAHRFVVLRANLRALARGDEALYAVYLHDSADLRKLHKLIEEIGGPSSWKVDSSAPAALGISMEWIQMGANGLITLHADEARYPDKAVLAVVNGEGEILGTHSLWTHEGDLASLLN